MRNMKSKQKKFLKIEYKDLICAKCNHPIIWQARDTEGKILQELKHLNVQDYTPTFIITISKDCQCGCTQAKE